MPRSLVALGANLGDRAATLAQAIELLRRTDGVADLVASTLHETAPIGGAPGQDPFLNAAAAFETTLSPARLHKALAQIESQLGRVRGERWAARAIDLDLLLYGELTINTPELTVPHPRMAMRRFVLKPAAEVGNAMIHPRLKWTVGRLLEHLNAAPPYYAMLGPPGSGKTALAQRLARAFEGRVIFNPVGELRDLGGGGSGAAGGPAYAREIELLEQRERRLALENWPRDPVLAVSDFYLDQSLAYARSSLGPREIAAFVLKLAEFRPQVILPKLLIVLDTSRSATGLLGPKATAEQSNLREAMSLVAARSGEGPVLYVGGLDADAQFQEVSAALQAMQ